VAPAAEVALPEASIVEGEYTAEMQPSSSSSRRPREIDPVCLLLTGAEVEGSTIPEAVLVEGIVPEAEVAAGAATEPTEIASGVALGVAEEVRDDVLPESSLKVVVRSLEIQDAEPIRSAPMSEAAATSRGRLELLADDLVDPATVARNLEAMRRAEQWMKVCISTLG
jgi:enoyl-CoA hydratase/carnithine racemase